MPARPNPTLPLRPIQPARRDFNDGMSGAAMQRFTIIYRRIDSPHDAGILTDRGIPLGSVSGKISRPDDNAGCSSRTNQSDFRRQQRLATRQQCCLFAWWRSASVPIPKFARGRGSLDANFGIKGTLAML